MNIQLLFTAEMSLKDYYESLGMKRGEFRDLVCEKLDIVRKTFYNNMNNNSFKEYEIQVIRNIASEFNENINAEYLEQ